MKIICWPIIIVSSKWHNCQKLLIQSKCFNLFDDADVYEINQAELKLIDDYISLCEWNK